MPSVFNGRNGTYSNICKIGRCRTDRDVYFVDKTTTYIIIAFDVNFNLIRVPTIEGENPRGFRHTVASSEK